MTKKEMKSKLQQAITLIAEVDDEMSKKASMQEEFYTLDKIREELEDFEDSI